MDRRRFLAGAASMLPGLLVPRLTRAGTQDFWTRDRVLWVQRPATREEFRVVYWTQGQVDVANYVRLCYLLRDVPENLTVMMDVNLLNLLYGIAYWAELEFGRPVPLVITSGQRTRAHNSRVEGAAQNSMHIYGRAVDLQVPGIAPTTLANMGAFFGMGGVGTYPTHTHLDTGRVRFWNGAKHRSTV